MAKKSAPVLKGLKLNWWQVGLFKLSTASFGILAAVYFTGFFAQYINIFWVTCVVPGLYIAYVYFKQR